MKKINFLLIFIVFSALSCKEKTALTPDPYAFLVGTWLYSNSAECVFDATTKSAKGTKVPTNNIYKFVVGEDYWKNVVTTGTDKWEYNQIVRYADNRPVEYPKSTMTKKDENTLSVNNSLLGDSELKRVK
jgi:hypothetical protein